VGWTVYARRLPSGAHCGSLMTRSLLTISVAFFDSTSMTHRCEKRKLVSMTRASSLSFCRFSSVSESGRWAMYAICLESGDQAKAVTPVLESEEHTSELQSQSNLVCRLLLEKKKYDLVVRDSPLHTNSFIVKIFQNRSMF